MNDNNDENDGDNYGSSGTSSNGIMATAVKGQPQRGHEHEQGLGKLYLSTGTPETVPRNSII